MRVLTYTIIRVFIFAYIILCAPVAAHAYVGPGAGLGAIAVTLAIMLGLCLLVCGFLWYPLKRLLRGNKAATEKNAPPKTED